MLPTAYSPPRIHSHNSPHVNPAKKTYLVGEQVSSRGTLSIANLSREEGIKNSLEGQPGEEETSSIGREGGQLAGQEGLQGNESIRRVVDLQGGGGHGTLVSVAGDVSVANPDGRHDQDSERDQDGAERDIFVELEKKGGGAISFVGIFFE